MCVISYVLIIILSIQFSFCEELLVPTTEGPVRGYRNVETGLFEFYGIPYATVPTGRDRFKAPLPPTNRYGILEATNDGIYCPQNLIFVPGLYQEDCLVLNLFVPARNLIQSFPVVVYIHGGSFEAGFGSQRVPQSIAQNDVIGVTINYRLGAHGFLCLHTETAPGNAGLKDQLAALRWLKLNIVHFGGNPNDITLAGYSAGGATAEILMLSPTNTNLFHKLILESGFGVASFAIKENPVEFALDVAKRIGATDNQIANTALLEDYYLSLSFEEMFSVSFSDVVTAGFCPCIEKKIGNSETIIEEDPLHILRNGTYTKLPLLTGYTNAEGVLFYNNRDAWLEAMPSNFRDFFPPNYSLRDEEAEREVEALIKSRYFGNGFIYENIGQNFVDYFSDSVMVYFGLLSARYHAQSSQPVFLYNFTFAGTLDLYNLPQYGAGHCAQTAYVLNNRRIHLILNENDILIRARVVAMWANFIKYGNPIPATSDLLPVSWAQLDPENMNFLQIDLEMKEDTWPRAEYMKFWNEIWTRKWEETDGANRVLPGCLGITIIAFVVTKLNYRPL